MEQIIAVAGPITAATRLCRELERLGIISCRVVHTPQAISRGGCSYSVRINESGLEELLNVSEKRSVKAVYREILREGEYEYENIS